MLVVRSVDAYYGSIQALKSVSLHVGKGEVVSLIGANGAGKTTTLRTISRLIPLSEGEILFEGRSLQTMSPEEVVRLGIGHTPEGRQIFAPLSVPDNLRLGAYCRRDTAGIARDIDWVYSLFPRLHERRTHLAGNLSGGEQQMLALGRTLMSGPKLLMLDEPSMGLAPLVVKEIFNVIGRLNAEGLTVLLVEQNARLALEVSHRGYVLETGRVVLSGTADELARSHEVQRAYLGRAVDGFLGAAKTRTKVGATT